MISVVVPAYNEEAGIGQLYSRVVGAAADLERGLRAPRGRRRQPDRTFELLRDLAERDPRLKILSFTRNFGHQAAVTAGLVHAGDIVAVIDAICRTRRRSCWASFRSAGRGTTWSMPFGSSEESALKRAAYHVYYRALRYLANVDIPLDAGDFCVISAAPSIRSTPCRSATASCRGCEPGSAIARSGWHTSGRRGPPASPSTRCGV